VSRAGAPPRPARAPRRSPSGGERRAPQPRAGQGARDQVADGRHLLRGRRARGQAVRRVGQRIAKGQVVCIIEAMKIMNEIESEYDGVVTEVLAENAHAVEYGQVLFRVDPNG
jgi:acetyl-CoA carboxylase biotin carboxyl carrier protein